MEKKTQSKAKELVNKVYQPMGYLTGLNLNSKQMYAWAKERAVENVNEIISALETTTGHCDLRKLDAQEVQSDFNYWNHVKKEIHEL